MNHPISMTDQAKSSATLTRSVNQKAARSIPNRHTESQEKLERQAQAARAQADFAMRL